MNELLHEYLSILQDPAHLGAEATFVAFEALLATPLVRWLVRRHDKKKHPHPAPDWPRHQEPCEVIDLDGRPCSTPTFCRVRTAPVCQNHGGRI